MPRFGRHALPTIQQSSRSVPIAGRLGYFASISGRTHRLASCRVPAFSHACVPAFRQSAAFSRLRGAVSRRYSGSLPIVSPLFERGVAHRTGTCQRPVPESRQGMLAKQDALTFIVSAIGKNRTTLGTTERAFLTRCTVPELLRQGSTGGCRRHFVEHFALREFLAFAALSFQSFQHGLRPRKDELSQVI